MKKICLIVVCLLCLFSVLQGQVEKGDSELQFMGYLAATSGLTMGTLQALYGYYITPKLQLGLGPAITITTMTTYDYDEVTFEITEGSETNIDLACSFFGTYNFSTVEKMIPYVTAAWYQYTFDVPEGSSFTDFSFLSVGGGVKYFLNEYVAMDGSATLGIPLGGGNIMFLLFGGLSIFL
jgi:hypothetical protein